MSIHTALPYEWEASSSRPQRTGDATPVSLVGKWREFYARYVAGGLPLKSSVDGGTGDREDLGEVADAVVSGVVHPP